MQIDQKMAGDVMVVHITGDITLNQGGDVLLKDKIQSLLHQGRKDILFNLADVAYVDSSGLGAIMMAYTTVTREGGTLKLANITRKLQDLLSITKMLTVFETFDSEEEALRSYKK